VAGFAGVVVVAAGLAGAASVVSVFAESPSAFGDSVAGFVFASSAGATALVAGFAGAAVNSAIGFSTAVAAVCASARPAVSRLKAITVNEVTMRTGKLEPNIFTSPFYVCSGRNIKRLRQ
jgi:hypothetical protein